MPETLEARTVLSASGYFFFDGDFDNNGVTNADDLDTINHWVGTADQALYVEELDLNRDDRVDRDDVEIVSELLLETKYGDANLDGLFTTEDIVTIMIAGEYDDGIANNSGWRDGDFNGDREVDSNDLVFAFQHTPFTPSLSAVPVPPPPVTTDGDVNGDGILNLDDLDALNKWVGPEDVSAMYIDELDINMDDVVNRQDVDVLAEYLLGTAYGDLDSNGVFDTSDMVIMQLWGHYEDDEYRNSSWKHGDFNGDFEVDSGDLVMALQKSIYEPLAQLDAEGVDLLFTMM